MEVRILVCDPGQEPADSRIRADRRYAVAEQAKLGI